MNLQLEWVEGQPITHCHLMPKSPAVILTYLVPARKTLLASASP